MKTPDGLMVITSWMVSSMYKERNAEVLHFDFFQ